MENKLTGYKNELMGAVKEAFGVQGGLAQKKEGEAEVAAAKGQQEAKATSQETKGDLQQGIGSLLGSKSMDSRGHRNQLKSDANRVTNL